MKRCDQTLLPIALLLFIAVLPASAFYNPTTGRWLSRDPIEEDGCLNIYCSVANAAPVYIDSLGLDVESILDLAAMLQIEINRYEGYSIIATMKYRESVTFLRSQLGRIRTFEFGPPFQGGQGTKAYYQRSINKLYIPRNVDIDTLLHELSHVVTGFAGFDSAGGRRDEGVGYTVEFTAGAFVPGLATMEDQIKRIGCDRQTIERNWQGFWKQFGAPNIWIHGEYGTFGRDFDGDDVDILNTEKYARLNYSCIEIAKAFNALIGDCCFRVSCATSSSEYRIGTGIDVTPELKH